VKLKTRGTNPMSDSIFNYDVTLQELSYLGIIITKEEYLRLTSTLKKYYDLHTLFILRKDNKKATEILARASICLNLNPS
jgi:hypothetical protein